MIKFLLRSNKKNALIRTETFKKGKLQFQVETRWNDMEIVVDEKPELRNHKAEEGFNLPNFFVKSGFENRKTKLIFPKNIPESEAKKIRNELREEKRGILELEDDQFPFDEHNFFLRSSSWDKVEGKTLFYGPIEVEEITYHLLRVSAVEYACGDTGFRVTKDEYKRFMTDGIPMSRDDYYELADQFCTTMPQIPDYGPMQFDIDDVDSPKFRAKFLALYKKAKIKKCKAKISAEKKVRSKTEYSLVVAQGSEYSEATLEIYEPFDLEKLKVSVVQQQIMHGSKRCYDTFVLAYGDDRFDFEWVEGHSEINYLVSPDDKWKEVDINFTD